LSNVGRRVNCTDQNTGQFNRTTIPSKFQRLARTGLYQDKRSPLAYHRNSQ